MCYHVLEGHNHGFYCFPAPPLSLLFAYVGLWDLSLSLSDEGEPQLKLGRLISWARHLILFRIGTVLSRLDSVYFLLVLHGQT